MSANAPQFIVVESREDAQSLQEGAQIPPSLTVVRLVDESRVDWERDDLSDEVIAITVRSKSRITAYRELRKQALDELGIAVGPLTVKQLDGEDMGKAAKLGVL